MKLDRQQKKTGTSKWTIFIQKQSMFLSKLYGSKTVKEIFENICMKYSASMDNGQQENQKRKQQKPVK